MPEYLFATKRLEIKPFVNAVGAAGVGKQRRWLGMALLIFPWALTQASDALADTVSIRAEEDTVLNNVVPSLTYPQFNGVSGANCCLGIGDNTGTRDFQGMFRFDIGVLTSQVVAPDTFSINSITFRAFHWFRDNGNTSDIVRVALGNTDVWDEDSATYNSSAGNHGPAVAQASLTAGTLNSYVSWNVSSIGAAPLIDNGKVTFYMFVDVAGINWHNIRPTESGSTLAPYLDIDFTINDNTPPVVTVTSPGVTTIQAGQAWSDPGATALDNIDGSLSVIVGGDTVDPYAAPGTQFTITYDAVDNAGNSAVQQSRTVTVVNSSPTARNDSAEVSADSVLVVANRGILFGERNSGSIQEVPRIGGSASTLVSGTGDVYGLDVDLLRDKVYWSTTSNTIMRANLDGTDMETILTGVTNTAGLVVDAVNGYLYWSDQGSDTIERSDLDGAGRTVLASTGTHPWGLSYDPVSGVLAYSEWVSNDVWTVPATGGTPTQIITSAEVSDPVGLDFFPGSDTLAILNRTLSQVSTADSDGDAPRLVRSGFGAGFRVRVDRHLGQLFVQTADIQSFDLLGDNLQTVLGGIQADGMVLGDHPWNLLENDSDPDRTDSLSVVTFDSASATGAVVSVNADGTYSYDPTAVNALIALDDGESTVDTFGYTVSDSTFNDSATVTITVNGVNDPPEAADDSGTVDEDTTLALLTVPVASSVLSNDSDPDTGDSGSLTVTAFDATSVQGASVIVNPDGTFLYDPTAAPALQALNDGDSVVDTFTYTVSDGDAADTATVSVSVSGSTDDLTGPEFTGVIASPSTAAEGDSITITFVASEPLLGDPTVTVNGNPASLLGGKGSGLIFEYSILETDPVGPATIIISGIDLAGNSGSTSNTEALTIITPVPLQSWPAILLLGIAIVTVSRRRKHC